MKKIKEIFIQMRRDFKRIFEKKETTKKPRVIIMWLMVTLLFLFVGLLMLKLGNLIDCHWNYILIPLFIFLVIAIIETYIDFIKELINKITFSSYLSERQLKNKKIYFIFYEDVPEEKDSEFYTRLVWKVFRMKVVLVWIPNNINGDLDVTIENGYSTKDYKLHPEAFDYLVSTRELKELNNEQLEYDAVDEFLNEYNANYFLPEEEGQPNGSSD